MKFSCSRPELYEIVSNVSRAVSGKTSLAVLEGILTVLIVIGMESFAASELRAIGFFRKEKTDGRA